MFKFAIKNLLVKKVQVILIILSIMVSSMVAIIAYNVSNQVSDGLINNAQYYSLIVGPSGSETQLAMNTMYFSDDVLGLIPYSIKDDFEKDSRVTSVVPFAMADEYNGYKIVGTSTGYLKNKKIKDGNLFNDSSTFEIVVGYNVASTCDLEVGDKIYTSHSEGETHHTPFTVVGILDRTYSSFDNVLFTELKSIWDVHEEHEGHDEHEKHEEMNNMVCALLVTTKNPIYAIQLVNEYDGKVINEVVEGEDKSFSLQAIEPMSTMRNVLNDTEKTKYIVYALAAVILFMNIIVITIITLLNMYESAHEIKLMRLIGISMKKINLLYLIQNAITGFISILLALILSRFGLMLMNGYASSMGVVLNYLKVYPIEIVILIGVFIINIVPTLIWTIIMSKKDGLN